LSLEVVAAGRSVVAIQVGSLVEIANEVSAIVIEPDLSRPARHKELRQHLGRQATAPAVDQFSPERMVGFTVVP
jgi:hypothetical protein